MKICEYYNLLREKFRAADFESPSVEAAYLLEEVTEATHLEVPFSRKELPESGRVRAEQFLARRLTGEPYQYIYGWTQFRDLRLSVGPGCLIPRPETELLPDLIEKDFPANEDIRVCELGAGSGAISLALASERPCWNVCASEISPEALAHALKNRRDLGLERVRIEPGDLFSPFDGQIFDAVAANLPYIAESERKDLPKNVRDFEPGTALFAPEEGFALIGRALREAPQFLRSGGRLYFEIGETQEDKALEAIRADGRYAHAEIRKDQYGADRFLVAARV